MRSYFTDRSEPVDTIYFGGGTPSLLDTAELAAIIAAIGKKFVLSNDMEITLEANPDDILPGRVTEWRGVGINRLSIGVQSFFEEHLRWMNRAHDAIQAIDCIDRVRREGIHNFNIDLIYGVPGLTDEQWESNLDRSIGLGIPHLSCYALTVEPRTALAYRITKGLQSDVDEEHQVRQFLHLMDRMETAGYEHYEISNFCKPGWRSRHNSSYWEGKAYYGFGPSAHSYDGWRRRSWNRNNNALYMEAIGQSVLPIDFELLSVSQQLNEYIMVSLRRKEGIDLELVEERFGPAERFRIQSAARPYMPDKIEMRDNRMLLTRLGKVYGDGIAADLFTDA